MISKVKVRHTKSGCVATYDDVIVMRLRDGKIVELQEFLDTAEVAANHRHSPVAKKLSGYPLVRMLTRTRLRPVVILPINPSLPPLR